MKIVSLDCHSVNPGDLSWEGIAELGDFTVYERSAESEVVERAKDADMILINKVVITRELLAKLPKLKYVGELATGFNNIDLEACKERGIVVTNIPAYSTDSVAQMVFAHLLNVATKTDHYASETRKGVWGKQTDFCYWEEPLMELAGKTLGIVGLGNIGCKVARIAHALGMDTSAYTSKNSSELPDNIRKTTLDGLFSTCDVISLHCPLNDETYHLINQDSIAKMRPGVILINTGRGALIDEEAVAEALKSGRMKAYCADVLTEEPPRTGSPLFDCENAYITPHIAWATLEARQRLMTIATENIRAYINGQPQNVVTP